ncbi:MAG: response regulator receiver protein [Bacteroidota bacterium]|jgi:CheY-like chemotaxis protein|nr:response regulator receiver protein [Bacteroidota bacterium]
MSKTGPIVIVEDELKEQGIYKNILQSSGIKNELQFFDNGRDALDYLKTTREDPFIIFSDIRMPIMDGIEFRRQIAANPYLRKKGTPFVFRTASLKPSEVKEAYELFVQGYFAKTEDMTQLKTQLNVILDYWRDCLDPPILEIKSEHL